jgi:excisionase family DNA binding protein
MERTLAMGASTPLLTIDEVRSHLNVSISTVRRLVRDGLLPAYRVGGRLRFRLHEVEAYVDAQRVSVDSAGLTEKIHHQ